MIPRITFREATFEDKDILLEWRNDIVTRKNSLNKDHVTLQEHESWLWSVLSSDDKTLLIAEHDSSPVGQVRFDKRSDGHEISITVAPGARRLGIGKIMLRSASEYAKAHKINKITATIKKGNVPSIKIFESAGYRLSSEKKDENDNLSYELYTDRQKIGLKIWSVNHGSFERMKHLYDEGLFDYIELYIVPGSFDADVLKPIKNIPVIFHGPNYNHKFNLCNKDKVFIDSIETISRFSDLFKENKIIFHPGIVIEDERSDIMHAKKNLRELSRHLDVILENVPREGYENNLVLLGSNPDDFLKIKGNLLSCLDIGHAIKAANSYNRDPFVFIEDFLRMHPYMFHLSDGDYSTTIDEHMHLSSGSFPLKRICRLLPSDARISLETPKEDFQNLEEDKKNLSILMKLLSR